jgi:hypothetical protein
MDTKQLAVLGDRKQGRSVPLAKLDAIGTGKLGGGH